MSDGDRASNSQPLVSIIVLNYNNYEDSSECVRSLENVTYENFDVYIVDNGSTDDSLERLREEFSEHHIIENGENLGFAAGNRVAVEEAISRGSDYVLLLNNDMVATDDFLTPMVETAETYEKVGLVGGLVPYYDDEIDEYWYAGGEISLNVLELSTDTQPKSNRPFETGYITGALMLINAEFAKEVDILRDEYFFGRDQLDISWRAHQNGWKVMVNPDASVPHKVNGTISSHWTPFKVYYGTRGRLFFAKHQLPLRNLIIFTLFFIVSRPYVYLKWISEGRPDNVKAQAFSIIDVLRADYSKRDLPME